MKKIKNTLFLFLGIAVLALSSCTNDVPTPPGGGGGTGGGGNGGGGTGGGGAPGNLAARTITDTAYGTETIQKMDIYLPAGRTANTRLVVLVHGGGWSAGDKSEMNILIPKLQAQWPNVAIANINYRLANGSTVLYDKMLADVGAAVQMLHNSRTALQISDTMGMIGASAGAQMALMYTYKYNTNNYVRAVGDFFGPAIMDDWQWYISGYNIFLGDRVDNVLTRYLGEKRENNLSLYEANSPYTQVKTGDKATIIFHGSADPAVPVYQSQWFSGKLKDKQVPYEYYEYPALHGFTDDQYLDCIKKLVPFFKKYM